MRLGLLAAEDEPEEFGVEEEDGGRDDPGDDNGDAGVGELAHFVAVAGELRQRDYGKGQLKAQNDLAQDEQRGDSAFTVKADDEDGGKNGDRASDQAAQPRLETNLQKTFHDNLAGKSAGERGILAGSQERAREDGAGETDAEDGTEKFVGVGDFGNIMQAACVEGRGAEDEDGGVDEESESEGQRGVENGVAHSLAAVADGRAEGASLHYAGMKIEIVRHDRGAEDADADVQHVTVAENFRARDEADDSFTPDRMSEEDFVGEAASDGGDQSNDEGLDDAESSTLQGEDDQNVESRDNHTRKKRQAEKQLEGNSGAKNFREVARSDSNFADDPKRDRSAARVMLAASLSQIAAGGDTQLCGKALQKHRHEVADKNDAEKGVTEFRAAADVGGPVARVHVADSYEVAGPGKRENFANPRRGMGNGY